MRNLRSNVRSIDAVNVYSLLPLDFAQKSFANGWSNIRVTALDLTIMLGRFPTISCVQRLFSLTLDLLLNTSDYVVSKVGRTAI